MRTTAVVEPGQSLLLRVPGSDGGPAHTRLVRVARLTRRPTGDYVVGCTFTPPLDEHELTALEQLLV
jgi:hypothetical protein